jgi:hypothetical protein
MFSLQVVSHIWAKDCPQYADFAKYQVHALRARPPKCDVLLTVCYCPADWAACVTLERQLALGLPPTVTLRGMPMDQERLFRRAIGRDEVCRAPDGKVLWLTDCDYVITGEACDAVAQVAPDSQLVFPRVVNTMRTHAMGTEYARRAEKSDTPEIDPADFQPERVKRGIGGVQIIGSELARQVGYDPPMKSRYDWRTDGFGCFKDDANWRRYVKLPAGVLNAAGMDVVGSGTGIDVPGVYRLRHEQIGYRTDKTRNIIK